MVAFIIYLLIAGGFANYLKANHAFFVEAIMAGITWPWWFGVLLAIRFQEEG